MSELEFEWIDDVHVVVRKRLTEPVPTDEDGLTPTEAALEDLKRRYGDGPGAGVDLEDGDPAEDPPERSHDRPDGLGGAGELAV